MKHTRSNAIAGDGFQPVRFLQPLLLGAFENVAPDFLELLVEMIESRGANPKPDYEMAKEPVEVPFIEGLDGKICMQETFLSYLWCIGYSSLVYFDEVLARPRVTPNYVRTSAQQTLINDATALFGYALGLFDEFKEWSLVDLPNPAFYTEEEGGYVEKADSVFVMASAFVMVHEYAHFYLGHLDKKQQYIQDDSEQPAEEAQAAEYEADQFSIQKVIEGAAAVSPEERQTRYIGVVIGLGAILLPHLSLYGGEEHPSPHKRLSAGLNQLQLDPDNNIWAVGTMLLSLWAFFNGRPAVGGNQYTTFQNLFEVSMVQLDDPHYYL